MTECLRCHYEGPLMCTFTINGEEATLCPECMVDFERFLRGYTLNDKGIIVARGFKRRDRE